MLDRFPSPEQARILEERLREMGATAVVVSGREVEAYFPTFSEQMIPLLIGLGMLLGLGVIMLMIGNRIVAVGRGLAEALVQAAPFVAAMIAAIGVLIVISSRS